MTVIGRSILAEFICRLNYSNLRRQFSLQNLKSPTWPSKKLPASTSISSMLPEGGIENALDPANATQKVCLQDGFARRELCKFLFSTCLSDDFQWVTIYNPFLFEWADTHIAKKTAQDLLKQSARWPYRDCFKPCVLVAIQPPKVENSMESGSMPMV